MPNQRIIMCAALALLAVFAINPIGTALADSVLIINGAAGTGESETTAESTDNLNTLLLRRRNTTSIVNNVPPNFAGFNQIWDVRFNNNFVLTPSEISQYVAFLQGGGSLVVIGENAVFVDRNTSLINLINAAGGGSLTFTEPLFRQTVLPPFTGPRAIAGNTIDYAGAGGVTDAGNGQFISVSYDDTAPGGTALAFGPGTLANAPAGRLNVVFDVNFMLGDVNGTSSNIQLFKNLIGSVQQPRPPSPIPEPATMLLLGTGLAAGSGVIKRRHQKKEK